MGGAAARSPARRAPPSGGRYGRRGRFLAMLSLWRRARRPATTAGVGRSTAYPWSRARFSALREQGLGVRTAAQELRVAQAGAWEAEPRREAVRACGAPRAVLVTRSGLRRAEPGGSRSRHQEAEGDRTDQASTTASCGPIRRSGPRTPLDGQLQAAAARKAPDSAERTLNRPPSNTVAKPAIGLRQRRLLTVADIPEAPQRTPGTRSTQPGLLLDVASAACLIALISEGSRVPADT